jgi:hypothetical protein
VYAIDDVLPAYDAREVHSVRLALPPGEAIELALATPIAADPLVRLLFRLRGLHARGTIGEALAHLGLGVLERRDGEVVFGASGTPWRPGGSIRPLADARPGSVRMATDFRSDGARLWTETRIQAVDETARRAFRRYWWIVGPFSALIRRRWLAQIARRAG